MLLAYNNQVLMNFILVLLRNDIELQFGFTETLHNLKAQTYFLTAKFDNIFKGVTSIPRANMCILQFKNEIRLTITSVSLEHL